MWLGSIQSNRFLMASSYKCIIYYVLILSPHYFLVLTPSAMPFSLPVLISLLKTFISSRLIVPIAPALGRPIRRIAPCSSLGIYLAPGQPGLRSGNLSRTDFLKWFINFVQLCCFLWHCFCYLFFSKKLFKYIAVKSFVFFTTATQRFPVHAYSSSSPVFMVSLAKASLF